jgi:Protein kinase domain
MWNPEPLTTYAHRFSELSSHVLDSQTSILRYCLLVSGMTLLRICALMKSCILCCCFIWRIQAFSGPVANRARGGRHSIPVALDTVPVYDAKASPPASVGLVFSDKYFYNGDDDEAKEAAEIRNNFFVDENVETVREVFARWNTVEELGVLARGICAEHKEVCAYFGRTIVPWEGGGFWSKRPELPIIILEGRVLYHSESGLEEIGKLPIHDLDAIPGLWEKAERLMDSGKINGNALAELVEASGGSAQFAKHAAALTNLERPPLQCYPCKMLLQQLVFSPISGLFYSFGPDRYLADSEAYCSHEVDGGGIVAEDIEPDAAIQATSKFYVLGTLEIDSKVGPNVSDMIKCVKLTSMTALALREAGVNSELMIPFVLGACEKAQLYINHLPGGHEKPEVKLLLDYSLSNAEERALFVAHLAVLLSDLAQMLKTEEGSEAVRVLDQFFLPCRMRNNIISQRTLSRIARRLAACQNRVFDLMYPWDEGPGLRSSDSYEGSGPRSFYFVGVRWGTDEEVFIKVWVDDSNPNRKDSQSEVDLQKQAYSHGVPCPTVVDDLTALSVIQSNIKFHRLVMPKLANDCVNPEDLEAYALSLVQAVLSLHSTGILHCDIKPGNIVWNNKSKLVSLIDFGHAQNEKDAQSYAGTRGFTAPEISRFKNPHSRITEAYSVGRTLLEQICRFDVVARRTVPPHVIQVAVKLCRRNPMARIMLDVAYLSLDAQQSWREHKELSI